MMQVLSSTFCRVMAGSLVLLICLSLPLNTLAQTWDWRQMESVTKQQKSRGVKILDTVRNSVKVRQKALEDEARKDDFFYYGTKSTNPQIRGEVETERQRLLVLVNGWSRAGEKEILAIKTNELNQVMTQSTAVAHYNGLDVIKLTKLYELGKDVIAGTLFELPDSTHPDDTLMYEKLKRRYMNKQMESIKIPKNESTMQAASRGATTGMKGTPVAPIVDALEVVFNDYFDTATDREIEIAEFMAKKNEYRVLLFKRVTLAYLRSLLASGEKLPYCAAEGKTLSFTKIGNRKFPVVGCPDLSLKHLRDYVNAIRTLQSAESDVFMAHARMVITEQQLGVDSASVLPLVGDAIDWYGLAYGLYAHEDFSGHCLTRLDYGIQFMAALLPQVTPTMIDGWLKRFPKGRLARFFTNMSELTEAATYANGRRVVVGVHSGLTDLSGGVVGKISEHNDLIADLAERWGVSRENMENFAGTLRRWVDEVEALEVKAAREAAKKAAKEAEELFMNETFTAAISEMRKLKLIKEMEPEYYETALKEAEETLRKNLLSYQPRNPEDVIRQSGMVPSHAEAIMEYLRRVKAGTAPDLDPEEIGLIYRAVNPKAAELMEQFGVHTKGMDIKGKSADWGAHEGFVPVDQNFSKLGNPNKRVSGNLSAEDAAKVREFHEKVEKFLKEKGDEAHLFKVELKLEGKPVKVVRDVKSGQEITVFYDPNTKTYLDKDLNPINRSSIDTTNERAMEVLAYPDKNGVPRPLTADYDLLAFGFTKDLEAPSFNPNTGFIGSKEKTVVAGSNQVVNELTPYDGNVSHHGAEYYNPYTPGAMEEDEFTLAFDLDMGYVGIKRCDRPCMIQWCKTTGHCTRYGFPKIPICNMKSPRAPCIAVDNNRLLKDYMHYQRIKKQAGYFPNKNWGWGEYNPLGGWSMVEFMEEEVTPGAIVKLGERLLTQSKNRLKRKAADFLGNAFEYASECPHGKRASDFIEESN